MKFLISAALLIALVGGPSHAAQAPVVRDPGVIYLADFDLKPVKLRVLEAAPTSFDHTGTRYAGTLKAGQDVELQAVGENLFRVRGRAQQGQILAWVSPDFLSALPDGFITSLRASNDRRIAVENLIAKREVAIGMTLEEVERSIGRPTKRSTRTNSDRTEHTWEYVRYQNIPQQTTVVGSDGVATIGTVWVKTPVGTLTLNFSDGIVASMDESEGAITQGVQTTIVAPPVLIY
ncbi:MAG: hypothetical protein ACOVMP_03060 [Chthoniobacterales bacterium]